VKNNIKVKRAKAGLTQAKLAELVKVSRQTINAVEANKYVPSTVLALRMASVFGCSVEEVFSLEKDEK